MRTVRRVLWVLVVLALAGFGWLLLTRTGQGTREDAAGRPVPREVAIDISELGGSFALTDQEGRRVSEKDVEGRPHAVFFGFTSCPDVCPTTLFALSQLLPQLGTDADRLKVQFVSVDPERDSVEQLKTYMSSFDPRILALTGSREEIDTMVANYKAYARKVPTESGYTMDHTAVVYLMGPDGRFAGTLDLHETAEVQLGKLRRLVARPPA
ncbi:SCO family protein [Ancylobacter pratisalsi]|uniref:SCO family protein n=1 Tax=Ancylobacter pratisalsi TaxID=1745854 RepID=A0A6P1YJK6_9HYPH|nr:SCO family protein [Ancylobacter pratisalsi]QIB33469.1 SCO family protein [Ancylobacter pratisalsi]